MSQRKYKDILQRIDTETGEILSQEPIAEGETYRIQDKKRELTPQQIRYINEQNEIKQFNSEMGGFIVLYYNNVLYNDKLNLDLATVSRVIYLATFMEYNSNKLVLNGGYASGQKITPMTKKNIKEVMKLSAEGFRLFFKDIIANEILIQNEDKTFTMNKKYFTKSKDINYKEDFTRVYVDTIRELYQNTNSRQHKTLAYAFKLLPKMDSQTNIICHNPNDRYKEPEKMTLKDIGEFLEVSTEKKNLDTFKKNLYKIVIYRNGRKYYIFKRVIIESGAGQNDYFVINPMLFYSGNEYQNVTRTIQSLLING